MHTQPCTPRVSVSVFLLARAFVHAVCQCAGLDSRGFNTRYRGDCCSLSACSTQPNDRLSSHRGAQPPFVERRVPRTSSTARTRPGALLLSTYARMYVCAYTREGAFRTWKERRDSAWTRIVFRSLDGVPTMARLGQECWVQLYDTENIVGGIVRVVGIR